MDLARLIQGLGVHWRNTAPGESAEVLAIGNDSRAVTRGSLFVARPGTSDDGRKYISDAIARGASAVLVDTPLRPGVQGAAELVAPVDPGLDTTAALLAERFYGGPSRQLALVGITGTNGKTTTAHLAQQLLDDAGVKCGLIGTIVVDDGRRRDKARWTTPPSHELSRVLASMVANGCKAAAMEVSSHALHQRRVAGLGYRVAVFTNLTGDHLDYHGSMEAYGDAKAMLFDSLRPEATAIVNAADPASARMLRGCRARVWRCRIGSARPCEATECVARPGPSAMDGTVVAYEGPWGSFEARLPLVGAHNVMNSLQAAAAAWATGFVHSDRQLKEGLETVQAPPGRLERVTPQGAPYLVLVDYAHTDDALRNVLPALRPLVLRSASGRGRLIVVFGCGGDRDRSKRPRMGRAATEFADEIWVTSDNPRTEPPNAIIDEILTGVPAASASRIRVDPDRRSAIFSAVAALRPGDCLLIAGKGHEEEQIVLDGLGGTRALPFSDAQVAREALAQQTDTVRNTGGLRATTGGSR